MSPSELVAQWHFRNHRVQMAHYESARYFERRHLMLGLPAILLSTIVGTTIFATISKDQNIAVQIVAGILSVAAAMLTALQTFLKYSELAEKHRLAGAKFAALKHQIELLSIFPPASDAELKTGLQAIEADWAKLREESPTLPPRIWGRIESSITFENYQHL
jgi:hypothetical protein